MSLATFVRPPGGEEPVACARGSDGARGMNAAALIMRGSDYAATAGRAGENAFRASFFKNPETP